MNPVKFFLAQFLVCLAWLLTFGSTAWVIVCDDGVLTVLQGWGMDDPIEIDLGKPL